MVSKESSLRCLQTASTYWLGVVRSSIAAARQNGGLGSLAAVGRGIGPASSQWQLTARNGY